MVAQSCRILFLREGFVLGELVFGITHIAEMPLLVGACELRGFLSTLPLPSHGPSKVSYVREGLGLQGDRRQKSRS